MSEIVLGPILVSIPLTVSENSVINFEAKGAADLMGIEDLTSISEILVRIENPDSGSVHQYSASITDATEGTFSITLTGANHTSTGKGRGRVLFDGVTVPLSRFAIEWEDAF